MMDEPDFDIMPAHILKPMHPKYNPDMDYKKFANFQPPARPAAGTRWALGSATEYKTDELLIMRRNPYFWTVDETGQQLPVHRRNPVSEGARAAPAARCA